MEAQGVLCCFTRIAGDTRTNSNVVAADGSVTELLEPGPEISEKELENFCRIHTLIQENAREAMKFCGNKNERS